jgi:hypothetical protein
MGKKAEERKIITSWAIHTQWTIQNDPLSLYVSLFNWGDVASILISSLLFFLLLGALPFIWKGAKRLWTRTHTHTQTNSAGAAAAASDFQSGAIRGRSVGFSNKWSGRQTETYWKKKEGWCGMFVGVFLLRPHTTHIFPCYPNTNCWCSFNGTARERERCYTRGKLFAFSAERTFFFFFVCGVVPSRKTFFQITSMMCSSTRIAQ